MWCRVEIVLTDVSEERIASIFGVEDKKKSASEPAEQVQQSMALGSTQPLTEMSTRNLLGGKGWPVHKADNHTAICEPIV
jgi:hypothetical protein